MALGTGQSFYSQRIGGGRPIRNWAYKGWARGQNSYAEDNEIRNDEFFSGVNIELQGKASIRMPRRGRTTFTTIPGATNFNGWGVYRDPVTSTNKLLSAFDGRLYRIDTSGNATEIDGTKTWDTSARLRGVLLRGSWYFGNAVDYLAKSNGTTVTRWTAVTAPTFSSLVLTGTGSDASYIYCVTAVTENGETEISGQLTGMGPGTLTTSNKWTLTWTRKTDAAVTGYNIYKSRKGGTLTQLTFVDQQASGATMTFVDDGVLSQSLIYEAPTFNTTGGVKGNIFGKYSNTLFVAGNIQEPDTVFYGGTGSNWESFSPSDNGGWVKPGRGDGDKVTSLIGFEDFLLIFKENSVWKFIFGSDGGPSLTAVIPPIWNVLA